MGLHPDAQKSDAKVCACDVSVPVADLTLALDICQQEPVGIEKTAEGQQLSEEISENNNQVFVCIFQSAASVYANHKLSCVLTERQ